MCAAPPVPALFRRLWRWALTPEGLRLLALLVAALGLRLLLAPFPGFANDVQGYVSWGQWVDGHFLHFYSYGASRQPVPAYPPLGVYLLGLLTAGYAWLSHLLGHDPVWTVSQAPGLVLLIKAPTLLAEGATLGVLYHLARERLSAHSAWWVTASYAFSPPVLVDGALWGQADGLMLLPTLLALRFAARKQPLRAGVTLAVAFLLKPQPLLLAPLLLFWFWRAERARAAWHAFLGMTATTLVVCWPYLLPPFPPEAGAFLTDVATWANQASAASNFAFNLWWLLGGGFYAATTHGWTGVTPQLLGDGLVGGLLLLLGLRLWRWPTSEALWLAASLLFIGDFVLATGQHERYLYPALALLLVASLATRRLWWAYGLATVTTVSNMALVVLIYMPVAQAGAWVLPWRTWLQQVGLPIALALLGIALANLVLLGGVFRRFWRQPLAATGAAVPCPAGTVPPALAHVRPEHPLDVGPER